MATYREIKGLTVPYLDADLPSASADTQEGGVWYNSATGKLRAFVASETWSTSAPLGTARWGGGGAGTQTAGLAFAGNSGSNDDATEEYDGSSWTAGGAYPVTYIQQSGGVNDYADDNNIYLIKADGSIVPNNVIASGFFRGKSSGLEPGLSLIHI